MSEEERKVKHIVARIVSITALVIGIATFLGGPLLILARWWYQIVPGAGGDFDFIGMFLGCVARLLFISLWKFWPITVIGLVLSIVTLFIERNLILRLYPLMLLIIGLCIHVIVVVIGFLMFLGG